MNRTDVQQQRLIELAEICFEQARAASTPQVTTELRRMAREYEQRAARLTGKSRESSDE